MPNVLTGWHLGTLFLNGLTCYELLINLSLYLQWVDGKEINKEVDEGVFAVSPLMDYGWLVYEWRKKHSFKTQLCMKTNLKISYLPVNVPLSCLKWSNLINLKIKNCRLLPISFLFFLLSFLFYQVAMGRFVTSKNDKSNFHNAVENLYPTWAHEIIATSVGWGFYKVLPQVQFGWNGTISVLFSGSDQFPYARFKLWKRCSLHMHYSHGKCVKNSVFLNYM